MLPRLTSALCLYSSPTTIALASPGACTAQQISLVTWEYTGLPRQIRTRQQTTMHRCKQLRTAVHYLMKKGERFIKFQLQRAFQSPTFITCDRGPSFLSTGCASQRVRHENTVYLVISRLIIFQHAFKKKWNTILNSQFYRMVSRQQALSFLITLKACNHMKTGNRD